MEDIIQHILSTVKYIISTYSVAAYVYYLVLVIVALFELKRYFNRNGFVNYDVILSSPMAPGISVVAPAYNESATIIENVKSLLSLRYRKFEVIIVNDGSKDDTLEKLIREFNLTKVPQNKTGLVTSEIKAVYKSKLSSLSRLKVVDKVNGGKADALNAGINQARYEYVCNIDVDSILDKNALLKLVKPFLDDDTVVASGGVIRIANGCTINDGVLEKVSFPTTLYARFQVLEYLRAFLIGRMAWSSINGLLLISGALGLFKKDIIVGCGGYNVNTVGEDMELVVRMQRYLIERKKKFKVVYLPNPLCWTEAPEDSLTLKKQRTRWTRGTIETLLIHRKLFFNKKYGVLGLLSIPLWTMYEWLSPIIEILGLVGLIIGFILGTGDWHFYALLCLTAYLYAIMLSMLVLLAEEITYRQYTSRKNLFLAILIAMLEPVILYPQKLVWAIQGNIQKINGCKTWGEMSRVGFSKNI